MTIFLSVLKAMFFSKGLDGVQKFNYRVLVYLVLGLIIFFLYLSNSNKNTEIANLSLQIKSLNSDIDTLNNNLSNCNSSLDTQNNAVKNLKLNSKVLDLKLQEASEKKLRLEEKVQSLLQMSKAPKDCEGATNWLVDQTEELKKWRN